MSEHLLKSIVVGMGSVTEAMLRVLQKKPWHEVVAVVDVRDESLSQAQENLALTDSALFYNLDEALNSIKANTIEATTVLINTPAEFHFAQTKTVLEAGLTPLVAKPLTLNFDQAADLVALAQQKELKLCVAQQMRFMRHYRALENFIAEGQLGEVEQLVFLNAKPRHEVRNLRDMKQPVLYEMTCHHLDAILSIFPKALPEAIVCDGFQPSWSVYDGPCMVNALIRFAGLHVHYHAGYSSQASLYELRLEGSKGALRCRGVHMSNNEMTYEFAARGSDFSPIYLDKDISMIEPWELFLDNWYSYLCGAEEPAFSGRNNLKVLAIVAAAIDSSESNAFVEVSTNPRFKAAFEAQADA